MSMCMAQGCKLPSVARVEVYIQSKRIVVQMCEYHMTLVRDVEEERELRKEQKKAAGAWGDPQKTVL